MRQTTWSTIGLQTVFVAFWRSCSSKRPTAWCREPYLSQSSLLRLPCKVPAAWTLREATRCNLIPDICPCSWPQKHYCLSLFELEVPVKELRILNCPKGKKVDCNLDWEKLVQNKQPCKHLRSFHVHTAERGPLCLPAYMHATEMDPFLKS